MNLLIKTSPILLSSIMPKILKPKTCMQQRKSLEVNLKKWNKKQTKMIAIGPLKEPIKLTRSLRHS